MLKYEDLTEEIIISFYNVYNKLGYGFLESVYQNALYFELKKQKLHIETQKKIEVYYEGNKVGTYYADMIIENVVILELKAESFLHIKHEKQLQNYLKASNIEVGLLLNFGEKPEFKRRIFSNNKK